MAVIRKQNMERGLQGQGAHGIHPVYTASVLFYTSSILTYSWSILLCLDVHQSPLLGPPLFQSFVYNIIASVNFHTDIVLFPILSIISIQSSVIFTNLLVNFMSLTSVRYTLKPGSNFYHIMNKTNYSRFLYHKSHQSTKQYHTQMSIILSSNDPRG